MVNYAPKTDVQPRGTFNRDICIGDKDHLKVAFGIPLQKYPRVVYAAVPKLDKEIPHSHWDNILGKRWDKLSENTVLWRMTFSVVRRSPFLQLIKMSANITIGATLKDRTDYREHVSTFVNYAAIDDDPRDESGDDEY